MNRRGVICGAAAFLGTWPFTAIAQVSTRPFVIAVLLSGSAADTPRYLGSFRRELLNLGYVEGRDCVFEVRSAEGAPDRLAALARELVLLKPRLILASATPAAMAAKALTAEIPIVVPLLADGQNLGELIASQARPGGNVTGILGPADAGLVGKRLALLREIVPGVVRVGYVYNSQLALSDSQRKIASDAALALSLELVAADIRSVTEVEDAFASLAAAGVKAAFFAPDPMFFQERRKIGDAARAVGLPTMFPFREHVEVGGLASYGIDLVASYRRAAAYADKIIRGAKPGDLPVELPTRFEFVLSLKTARAIGLKLPETLLVQADEVIE